MLNVNKKYGHYLLDKIDLEALGPLTGDEALAILDGQDLSVYRAEQVELAEITKEAEHHMFTAPSKWPSLEFNWDLGLDARRFTLDGCNPENFTKHFPQGLLLGWVELKDFDAKLSPQNWRAYKDLWTAGDPKKLARVIEYIRRGKSITPPLAAPLSEKNQVCLVGGNHRYTVAKFTNQHLLPLYVDPDKIEEISTIVTIDWS